MLTNPTKKNKINLTDYNYRRDIENRLLMSQFSIVEVEVLEEILNGSLHIPIAQLQDEVELEADELKEILAKLSKTGLFSINEDMLIVSKEMRKYYEKQVEKFDDKFRPDMVFIQQLLSKVPISVLPTWYAIPKTSNNIIESIVEKYLLTPRIYDRYLEELSFEDPVMQSIVEDVFNAPDFRIRSRTLREKYGLTRELFEEYMLHLEFNFVCFLQYTRIDDQWKEVVTPFHEWRQYLAFVHENEPQTVEDESAVQPFHQEPLGFVMDMERLLTEAENAELPLDDEVIQKLSASSPVSPQDTTPAEYFEQVLQKCEELGLVETSRGILEICREADDFLDMDLEERASYLHRFPIYRFHGTNVDAELLTEKNIREAERCIRSVLGKGWVTIEDFMKGLVCPVGSTEEVTLKKEGKRWRYVLPEYTKDEKRFLEYTVWERLFQIGVVEIGYYQGKRCFRATDLAYENVST